MDEIKLYDRVLTPEEIAAEITLFYLPLVVNNN